MSKTDWDKVAPPTTSFTPLAYTVKDAVRITGMSRSRLYEEMKAGHLIAKKSGRSTLIPHESIQNWLKNLDNYPASSTSNAPKPSP